MNETMVGTQQDLQMTMLTLDVLAYKLGGFELTQADLIAYMESGADIETVVTGDGSMKFSIKKKKEDGESC